MQFQEISITLPQKVIGNSKGEGVAKEKDFKEPYGAKLEFLEGWGWVQTKKALCGKG